MNFKLDENLDVRLKALFAAANLDVATVVDESMQRAVDPDLWAVCREEQRTLVTQDLDFSNILRYPVKDTPGIAVLRGPDTRFASQQLLIRVLLQGIQSESPVGRLWVVEPDRIRVRIDQNE